MLFIHVCLCIFSFFLGDGISLLCFIFTFTYFILFGLYLDLVCGLPHTPTCFGVVHLFFFFSFFSFSSLSRLFWSNIR